MTLAQLIPIALQVSIALIVFCVGLRTHPGDLTYLLRRPSLLVRSILAMNVIMPILAALIAGAFKLRPEIEAALVLLAVSPVPPILPGKQGKAGGDLSYGIGLLAVSAVLAIVTVPLTVSLIGSFFGLTLDVPMSAIARVVTISVIGPLILGVIVQRLAPSFAGRAAGPLSTIAILVLVIGFVPVVIRFWPAIAGRVGDFTLVAVVLFVIASLAVGHLLGGPEPEDRTVLGLSTACRHPGVAMAIVSATAAPEDRPIVAASVLLCVLVGAIVTGPYVLWRKRSHAASVAAPAR